MKEASNRKKLRSGKMLQIAEKEAEYLVFTGEAITQLIIPVMNE